MEGIPQATLLLVNLVVSPLSVRVLQAFKRWSGLSGRPMAYIAVGFSFGLGALVAVAFGLVTAREALSPYVLLGSGGIVSALAGLIYNVLKERLGLGDHEPKNK